MALAPVGLLTSSVGCCLDIVKSGKMVPGKHCNQVFSDHRANSK